MQMLTFSGVRKFITDSQLRLAIAAVGYIAAWIFAFFLAVTAQDYRLGITLASVTVGYLFGNSRETEDNNGNINPI